MITRRDLIRAIPAASFTLVAQPGTTRPVAEALANPAAADRRPTEASIGRVHAPLINHLGYRLSASKHVMVAGGDGLRTARIVRTDDGPHGEVATIPLRRVGPDFGAWLLGDFSQVRQAGNYRVAVPFQLFTGNPQAKDDWAHGIVETWSHTFAIGDDVNDKALRSMVDYYRVQSCGASAKGYNTPCHVGAMDRDDGGLARPWTGGWHSAHDHARDLPEILHGMFGLLALAESRPDLAGEEDVDREVRWGNDYFLQLQDKAGHVYFGVYPKDYYGTKDSWNNAEYHLATRPAPLYCQHLFIAAEATLARVYRERSPEYAMRCLDAAERCCRRWTAGTAYELTSYDLGTGAFAMAELYRASGRTGYAEAAKLYAGRLVTAQTREGDWPERAGKEYDTSLDYDLLNARALYPAYAPIGLAAVLRAMPGEAAAPAWRGALARFQRECMEYFAGKNGFGIAPQCPSLPADAPRTRRRGARHFRYFMDSGTTTLRVPGSRPIPWQAGHNGVVAGYGVALAMMASVTGDRGAAALAQRQWDWIVGLNPSSTCHVLGFGRNNPVTYPPVDFVPPVPEIAGAAMQGFIGADDDQPTVVGGYYATGEYWMPQHSWTLWLGSLLSAK